MRYLAMGAAGVCLLAMAAGASLNPAAAAGLSTAQAPIVLAQAEPKKETLTHEVKRKVKKAWRNMTGYKFDVACPALIPLTHSTCTETGKTRDDARAKCQSQSPLCSVSEVK
jgi:hypothetical protein